MKLAPDLVQLTALVAPPVADELARAAKLAELGFVTEAGLRLGRAVEACLYCTARELSLEVTDRKISGFTDLGNQLRQKEVEILRKKAPADVERLYEVVGRVARLIFKLAADSESRAGTPTSEPKRTEALLREMSTALSERGDPETATLMKHQPLLRSIQTMRNQAAHASPSGDVRELDDAAIDELSADVSDLIRGLLQIILGARARSRAEQVAA